MPDVPVDPAWLLRVTRTHAADRRLRTAAVFAAGSEAVPPVNRSQVTRWERGEITPSYEVVRRYEVLCGLDEGRLSAALDLVHRYATPVACAPALRRPLPPDPAGRADELVDKALTDGPLTGVEWDQLTAILGSMPDTFLLRRDWQDLVRRGVREMGVTVGLAYRQRAEAMNRVAGHPRAARHVADLVEQILTDPTTQVFSEPAALLQYCPDPTALPILREVIAAPVSPHALRAGLFAAATTLRQRQAPHELAVDLVRLALDLARDSSQPYRVRRSAADVLLALSPSARRAIALELRRRPEDLSLASIVAGDGPRPREQLRVLRDAIRARLEGVLGSTLHEEARLLKLLDYISVETNDERRSLALHLLMLLPFGPAVGSAYVQELHDSVRRGDALGLHESLGVLLCLTPGNQVDLLADLAVRAVDVPDADQVAVEACWALGNAKFVDPRSDEPGRRIADAVRAAWSGGPDARPPIYSSWAYVLGMLGRRDLLEQLVAPPDAPAAGAWEDARAWWLAVPAHLDLVLESRARTYP